MPKRKPRKLNNGGLYGRVDSGCCGDYAEESHFDCNKDDYFNSNPNLPPEHILSRYWNSANSLYLIRGGNIALPPPDTSAPVVTISQPANGSVLGNRTTIQDSATDNVKVTKMEIYNGSTLLKTSTSGSIKYGWNTRNIVSGPHTITVKAYDTAGNIGQSSVTVNK